MEMILVLFTCMALSKGNGRNEKKIKTYIFIIWLFNKNEQWQKVIEQ